MRDAVGITSTSSKPAAVYNVRYSPPGPLLPPWTDEHIKVIQLAIAGGIAREQDFFDEEQRATRLDRAAALAEEYVARSSFQS